jgi:hypothetical protein
LLFLKMTPDTHRAVIARLPTPKYAGALPGFHLMLRPALGRCTGSTPVTSSSMVEKVSDIRVERS